MTTINLFHSSGHLFSSFNPYSHFGDEAAAKINIGRKLIQAREVAKGGAELQYHLDTPAMYRISLHVEAGEILELGDDWGNPNSLALAATLRDFYGRQGDDHSRVEAHAIWKATYTHKSERAWDDRSYNLLGFSLLTPFLKVRNVVAISYINEVERGDTELSVCVVDPSRITIEDRKPISPEEIGEYAKLYEKLRQL